MPSDTAGSLSGNTVGVAFSHRGGGVCAMTNVEESGHLAGVTHLGAVSPQAQWEV